MKRECTTCGGTGQVGFFQGVSRFLITWEECQECCGTGYTEPGEIEKHTLPKQNNKNKSKKKKDR